MKASTKFLKMYEKLPEQARTGLVYGSFDYKPYTVRVIALEVRAKTDLSKKILKDLGYEDGEEDGKEN